MTTLPDPTIEDSTVLVPTSFTAEMIPSEMTVSSAAPKRSFWSRLTGRAQLDRIEQKVDDLQFAVSDLRGWLHELEYGPEQPCVDCPPSGSEVPAEPVPTGDFPPGE